MSRRRATLLLGAMSVIALLGAWQDFTIGLWYHLRDAGFFLQGGARLARGEMPYRDYIYAWPPLTALLMAGSLRFFGFSLWAAKLPLAAFTAANAPLAYRWLRRMCDRPAAFSGAVAVWLFAPLVLRLPYPTAFGVAPAFFLLLQLQRMRPGRLVGPALLAGLACGIGIGIKHNIGILLGLAVWVFLLVATPYNGLLRARPAGNRRVLNVVRGCAAFLALGALAVLALRVPSATRTIVITLAPAAVLTACAAVRAWRIDGTNPPGDWRELVVATLCVGVGIFVTVIPWVAWLHAKDALVPFLEYGLFIKRDGGTDWAAYYGRAFAPPWPSLGVWLCLAAVAATAGALVSSTRRLRVLWTIVTMTLLAAAWLTEGSYALYLAARYAPVLLLAAPFAFLRNAPWPRHIVTSAVVPAAWCAAIGFPAATAPHVTMGMLPAIGVGVAVVWVRTRPDHLVGRVAAGLLLVAMLTSWWHEWFVACVDSSKPRWELRTLARAPGPHGGTWMPAEAVEHFVQVRNFVETETASGAPLVAWPSLGFLNFYTGRPNPTSMDYFWQGIVGEQIEPVLLQQLIAAAPEVIVLDYEPSPVGYRIFEHFHPSIAEYIAEHYDRVGPLAGSFALMQRRAPPVSP